MTNEQAAQILRYYKKIVYEMNVFTQAIDVAIKALEKADKWDALDEKIAAFKTHSRKMT